ncbi:MAG: condensation protein [Acidobacteria bacterium]|nr:condensation protein [Acidobacteriota bacterium]
MSNALKPLSPAKRELLALLLKKEGLSAGRQSAIPRRAADGPCPLSFAQQRLWFLDQLEPGNAAYNVPVALRLTGALDAAALEQSLNEVVRRHEVLRTSFAVSRGLPVQVVAPELRLSVERQDLAGRPAPEAEAHRLLAERTRRPFDLSRLPLVRACLFRLEERTHLLLLVMHHVISDGWSLGVLLREMTALYDAYSHGRPSPLAELPVQYGDYAVWQRGWLQGEVLEEQLAYWRGRLGDRPAKLALPADHPAPPVPTGRGAQQALALSAGLTRALKELGRREGATLFMTLLAGFKALLHCYTHQDEMVLATDAANRQRVETEGLIGFFVNMLVLRTDLSGDPTFRELLGRVREVALGAYAHQALPFEKLVEHLQPEREQGGATPLFRAVFALQNAPMPAVELEELRLDVVEVAGDAAKFDLVVNLWEEGGTLGGFIRYSTDLFEAATVAQFAEHYARLLALVAARPETRLARLDILSEHERAAVERSTAVEELEGGFRF